MLLTPTFALLLAELVFAATSTTDNKPQPQGNFDIYTGPNLQEQHVNDPAHDLSYTLTGGQPFFNPYVSERIGTTGPLLLQNVNLIEQLAHFVRERVPERVVHAKGAGAHGFFEVTTTNGANLSMASVFSKVGKRTPVTARLSTVAGNLGEADSIRDLRGLAFKLRTDQGILDWATLNHPIFWFRDPAKFPHFVHSQKRHPSKHVLDNSDFWDPLSANPESINQVMRFFSDLGTPLGFRHMNGHAGNTFRAVREDGSWHYIKISFISDQGIKNNTQADAIKQAGESPDFGITDLWNSIEAGQFPSWTVYFQAMTPAQAQTFKYNIFDLTKEWLPEDVPLQEIGRITLNQNVRNYFQEVEQISFDPAQMPPGLEPSEDPVLQARLFAYGDAARYRIGVNHKQLPINCPLNVVAGFTRDGVMSFNNQGSRPELFSTQDQMNLPPRPYPNDDNHTIWTGGAVKFVSVPSEIDFEQPRIFWNRLSHQDQENLISNVIGHLGLATNDAIRLKQAKIFAHVNATLGQRIADGVKVKLN